MAVDETSAFLRKRNLARDLTAKLSAVSWPFQATHQRHWVLIPATSGPQNLSPLESMRWLLNDCRLHD